MNKLEECLEISDRIISKYVELISIRIFDEKTDIDLVDEIKGLVLDEYKLILSMSLEEIEIYLDELSFVIRKDKDKNDTASTRVYSKLIDYKEVLNGRYACYRDFGVLFEYCDIKFSIYDGILSMVDIDLVKRLKFKLDNIIVDCDGDKEFLDKLYELLESSKIDFLFTASAVELIALYTYMDIDKMPLMKIDDIKKTLSNPKYGEDSILKYVESTLALYSRRIIDNLAIKGGLKNNPKDVFGYLVTVTQIEILVDYMDRLSLSFLLDYCDNLIDNNNKYAMNNIKRLIKKKMN